MTNNKIHIHVIKKQKWLYMLILEDLNSFPQVYFPMKFFFICEINKISFYLFKNVFGVIIKVVVGLLVKLKTI